MSMDIELANERNASATGGLSPPSSDAIARQVLNALLSGKIEKSPQGLAKLRHIATGLLQSSDEQTATKALDGLSAPERELVSLHRERGCTMDEIAKLKGQSKEQIIKALARIYARVQIQRAP
jgi:DNA-directed RNA polymerase specialized sigma24 family protein